MQSPMPDTKAPEPLAPEMAARLAEFARACKAATRAVSLYPPTHPAIAASLARLVGSATRATAEGSLGLAVRPNDLLVDGRAAARPDPAIGELASLLHLHLLGEVRVYNTADADTWRSFLLLLSRAPEDVRAEGGIAKLWSGTGGRHIDVREVDYAEVLKDHWGGEAANWEAIVESCLQGSSLDLDELLIEALLGAAADPARFNELVAMVQARAGGGGISAQTAALVKLLRGVVEHVTRSAPDQMDPILRNVSAMAAKLTPDAMLEFLKRDLPFGQGGGSIDAVGEFVRRMADDQVAHFVSNSVVAERGATARLAQAFQALVPEIDRKRQLLGLIEQQVAQSPLGQEEAFPNLWQQASDMLTSYSDESFVSEAYARELSTARSQAVEVEKVSDDPPERISAWLGTVSDSALRHLDLQLLLDLLALESDLERWRDLTEPVVAHVEDLVLLGDFEAAQRLVDALVHETGPDGEGGRGPTAKTALERLAAGPMIRHVVGHLATVDDHGMEAIKRLCQSVGPHLIRSLAEVLSAEEGRRSLRRLRELLLGFGALGRHAVEQLKTSANPEVRRTAVALLREFGGIEALPDLVTLLDDAEPHVQREAIRAILQIGTDEAYETLQHALTTGRGRSRQAIMQALGQTRDERAAPLFSYILQHTDHRGAMRSVYIAAMEALARLGGADAVKALQGALYKGEWWAPFRTATLRATAAAGLSRIGTPEALGVLREASTRGPRGVRAAARHELTRGRPAAQPRLR